MDPFLPDDSKLDAIRELLPSVASGIRLDITIAGPFPAETDRAVRQLVEYELQVGRGGQDRAEELAQRAGEARSVVAAVLAASPDEVVLAPGIASALSAILMTGDRPARGGIVVVGDLAWDLDAVVASVAEAFGLPLVRSPSGLPDEAALVLAAHVDPVSGRVLDPRSPAHGAHAVGAPLLLDMGWSAGAIPVDAPSTGADFVLAGTHRWLLGPEGATALWIADPARSARVRALVDPLPAPLLVGVARSVGWLLMFVGLPWAFQRAEMLASRLRGALAAIDGVTIATGGVGFASTLPFAIAGWSAGDVATELGRRAHAQLDVDVGRDLLVASVGAWIREDEIDRFTAAVTEIAAHTPDSLPRRPLLTVLSTEPWDER